MKCQAWEFSKTASFEIVTILPPAVMGPVIYFPDRPEDLSVVNFAIWQYLTGHANRKREAATVDPPLPVVDVRDVSRKTI